MRSLISERKRLEKLVKLGKTGDVDKIAERAQRNGNAVLYFLANSAQGHGEENVSDRSLFYKGWQQAKYTEQTERAKLNKYQAFCDESGGLRLTDFGRQTLEKIELLTKYFPGKFNRQRLEKQDPVSVGALFNRFYISANRRLEECL